MGVPVWSARDPATYGETAAPLGIDFSICRDLTPLMWTILVDWLKEVTLEFRLGTRAFQTAVSYLHCFLSCDAVSKSAFQGLGVACLQLAAHQNDPSTSFTIAQAYDICAGGASEADIMGFQAELQRAFSVRTPRPILSDFLPALPETENPTLENLRTLFCDAAMADSSLSSMLDKAALGAAIHDLSERLSHLPATTPTLNSASDTSSDGATGQGTENSSYQLKRRLYQVVKKAARSNLYIRSLHRDAILTVHRTPLDEFEGRT